MKKLDNNLYITIGIPTVGHPEIERQGDYTLLRNMLIGKEFHWQKSIEALLPGEVEIREDGDYRVVNRLPIEKYLRCVVGSEMNPGSPEEFLKAHAVISRSWAVGKILRMHDKDEEGKIFGEKRIVNWEDTCDHDGFDVCSDDHCQRYQGIQPIPERVLDALIATEGEVLISPSGRLVDARFSKCCGGKTEVFSSCWQNREEECLESFNDPWCNLENILQKEKNAILKMVLKDYDLINEGGFRWETEITEAEIRENLQNKFGRRIGRIKEITIEERGASGRVKSILLKGSEGEIRIGKELMIRRLLSPSHLYSSWFDIVGREEDRWRLYGHGWGHGVGLCQIGAARMALNGYTYRDILAFYYPGSKIEKNLSTSKKIL